MTRFFFSFSTSIGSNVSGWIISIVGFILTTFVLCFFSVLNSFSVIAVFFPVVMASGGNVGVQSSVIGVRGLATGVIDTKDLWKSILKEVRVAFGLSFLYIIVLGIMVLFLFPNSFILLVVVCLSVSIIILVAASVGISIPIILKMLKIDPAVSTSPMVTSLMDILGLFIYFIVARHFLIS